MTDLEMTKLCAEAMGLEAWHTDELGQIWAGAGQYDPLHDDAQAMALVKRFGLSIKVALNKADGRWRVNANPNETGRTERAVFNDDLNRAIVECVAKMQAHR